MATHKAPYHLLNIITLFFFSSTFIWCQELSIRGYNGEITQEILDSNELTQALFDEWMIEHGKVYRSNRELLNRYEKFKESMKLVNGRNSLRRVPTDYAFGLNQFSDLSLDEFEDDYCSCVSFYGEDMLDELLPGKTYSTFCNAPEKINWASAGYINPPVDQGNCRSCWAFAATGVVEAIHKHKTNETVELSVQQLVDCCQMSSGSDPHGCLNGGKARKAFGCIGRDGIALQSKYQYTGQNNDCPTNYREGNMHFNIVGSVTLPKTERDFECALVDQPIAVVIHIPSRDLKQFKDGIYDGPCSSELKDMNHAAILVGYENINNIYYWVLRHSYGTKWGNNGYMYLKRDTSNKKGSCGILNRGVIPDIPKTKEQYIHALEKKENDNRLATIDAKLDRLLAIFDGICTLRNQTNRY